jgi:hypothetical protein
MFGEEICVCACVGAFMCACEVRKECWVLEVKIHVAVK